MLQRSLNVTAGFCARRVKNHFQSEGKRNRIASVEIDLRYLWRLLARDSRKGLWQL
jgi:hypothetical protein